VLSEFKQYPTYFLAQKISIADIIDRVEAVLAFIWLITIFFKIVILLYAVNLGVTQVFNLRQSRPFIFPLGLLLLLVTQFITENVISFNNFFNKVIPPYTLTFGLLLPLFLLFVYRVRRKKFETQAEQS
ncbi:GerAB/ArcD/ProY family transporter, partial [Anaerobacillus arseniciselenatis]|uniref:GerAB/ArcD/ProY family transporter n=1 Tax=Anaerobacillus arseniciselenatis TaxID=85682 RepID=UPI0014718145